MDVHNVLEIKTTKEINVHELDFNKRWISGESLIKFIDKTLSEGEIDDFEWLIDKLEEGVE